MLLRKFADWFSSARGVYQTLVIVAGWVAAEYLHFIHDNNMFQLMAWLTIYSAVTQPVLAYANRQDTSTAEAVMERIEQFECEILRRMEGGPSRDDQTQP